MNENYIYQEISPIILKELTENMTPVKNILYVEQIPSYGYAYCPGYISAGPQTHYAIYKVNYDKLELIYQALLIVYDGCSGYLINKNIKQVLRENKLNNSDIDFILQNKYEFITPTKKACCF